MNIKERSSEKNFLTGMKRILASVLVGLSPMIALAQYLPSSGIGGLFGLVGSWVKMAFPLVVSIAVVYFIWQVFQFAVAGDEEKKAQAKTQIIWGIVGIFVMVSVWGLVGILQSTLGTSGVKADIGDQLPI